MKISRCQNCFGCSGLSVDLLMLCSSRSGLSRNVCGRLAVAGLCDYLEGCEDLLVGWQDLMDCEGDEFTHEMGRRSLTLNLDGPLFRRVNELLEPLDILPGVFVDMAVRVFSNKYDDNGGVVFPSVSDDLVTFEGSLLERSGVQMTYEHKRNLGILADKWGVAKSQIVRMVLDDFFDDLRGGMDYRIRRKL